MAELLIAAAILYALGVAGLAMIRVSPVLRGVAAAFAAVVLLGFGFCIGALGFAGAWYWIANS
jgi:hypothetical protein